MIHIDNNHQKINNHVFYQSKNKKWYKKLNSNNGT